MQYVATVASNQIHSLFINLIPLQHNQRNKEVSRNCLCLPLHVPNDPSWKHLRIQVIPGDAPSFVFVYNAYVQIAQCSGASSSVNNNCKLSSQKTNSQLANAAPVSTSFYTCMVQACTISVPSHTQAPTERHHFEPGLQDPAIATSLVIQRQSIDCLEVSRNPDSIQNNKQTFKVCQLHEGCYQYSSCGGK